MKRLHWIDRDDLTELRDKPAAARRAIGAELRRLQQGERPLNYRMLSGFGTQVGELKRGKLRLVYTTECPSWTVIVCLFDKDSKGGDRMRLEHQRLIERRLQALRSSDLAKPDKPRLN